MMKYLFLIGLASLFWWLWRKAARSRSKSTLDKPPAVESEDMVRCSLCGVNQPVSDSILAGDRYFCNSEHRRIAESEGR